MNLSQRLLIHITLLCCLSHFTAIHSVIKFSKQPSYKPAIWQDSTILAAVSLTGIAVVGTIYSLYSYITRFNLYDAQQLSKEIKFFSDKVSKNYEKELDILSNAAHEEERRSQLDAIILEAITPTPYMTYVNKASRLLKECERLINKIENGTTKLKKQLEALTKKQNNSSRITS